MKHFLYRHCTPGLYYHYLVLINQAITSQMGTKKKEEENLVCGHEMWTGDFAHYVERREFMQKYVKGAWIHINSPNIHKHTHSFVIVMEHISLS